MFAAALIVLLRAGSALASEGTATVSAGPVQSHEGRPGGISLTTDARVPLDPADIVALRVLPSIANSVGGRLAFEMKDGSNVLLPDDMLTQAEVAETALCVYDSGQPIAFSLTKAYLAEGQLWHVARYSCDFTPFTDLGAFLLTSDAMLGAAAFGTERYALPEYEQPRLTFHPLSELALDDAQWQSNGIEGRFWLVLSDIAVSTLAGPRGHLAQLVVKDFATVVKAEFWRSSHSEAYYSAYDASADNPNVARYVVDVPAATTILAELNSNPLIYRSLPRMDQIAAFAGVLLWARHHGVQFGRGDLQSLYGIYAADQENRLATMANGPTDLRLLHSGDKYYPVIPAAPARKVNDAEIARPAAVFNQYGLSRMLWRDGSTSRLVYDDVGRLVSLVGRTGNVVSVPVTEDANSLQEFVHTWLASQAGAERNAVVTGASAFTEAELAAAGNNADAQRRLADMFDTGRDVARNYAAAMYWYRRAASQDNAGGFAGIASMYLAGHGVQTDYGAAAYWYRDALLVDPQYVPAHLGLCRLEKLGERTAVNACRKGPWGGRDSSRSPSPARPRGTAVKRLRRGSACTSCRCRTGTRRCGPLSLRS